MTCYFDLLLACRFKQSNKGHVIQVQPRDDIDFVCPYYAANSSHEDQLNEYYVIYQVSDVTKCSLRVSFYYGSRRSLNAASDTNIHPRSTGARERAI